VKVIFGLALSLRHLFCFWILTTTLTS